MSRSLS